MTRVVIRGESVYECDVCKRRIRVPTNRQGMDVMPRCNITAGCRGLLRRVTTLQDINSTPATPPEVEGVQDWYQRNVLYTHQQPIRSDSWVVEHNLQNIPIVHVFVYRDVGDGPVLVPFTEVTVETVNANTSILRFPSAESGQVQCVSLVSKNVVNYTSETSQVTSDIPVSSASGEVTIATLDASSLLDIQLTFSNTMKSVVNYVGVDNVPTVESAWVGTNSVIVNGRKYTVRSFNITSGAPQLFATDVIPSGTSFVISGVNTVPILPNQVLFLLSRPPHTYADRIYDEYVDAAQVSVTTPEMYYATGTVSTQTTVVRSTYPLILVV